MFVSHILKGVSKNQNSNFFNLSKILTITLRRTAKSRTIYKITEVSPDKIGETSHEITKIFVYTRFKIPILHISKIFHQCAPFVPLISVENPIVAPIKL
jgi:hypothetical protein